MEHLRTVILMVNEGKYTTHGAYGDDTDTFIISFFILYATMQSL